MMSFTANQWAILALVLVLGWLLGLLSRPSNVRWKRAVADERVARAEAEQRLAVANTRIVELERTAHPVVPGTAAAVGAAAAGRREDLSLIRGVGRDRETRLNEYGIHNYRDLEGMGDRDAADAEARMGLPAGTIAREQWREQAATLRNEGLDAHRTRWG
jgi:predicted flap endonuclease-1-like 5' DNA nuclease